jgi:DNA-directed RNA polymerase specialized sigma24 family protein
MNKNRSRETRDLFGVEPALWSYSAEALLLRLPANEAAILRLRVLESRSLISIAAELGVSTMSVSRHEKAALAALREQLARARQQGQGCRPQTAPCE